VFPPKVLVVDDEESSVKSYSNPSTTELLFFRGVHSPFPSTFTDRDRCPSDAHTARDGSLAPGLYAYVYNNPTPHTSSHAPGCV
jgi:hypothetical protein